MSEGKREDLLKDVKEGKGRGKDQKAGSGAATWAYRIVMTVLILIIAFSAYKVVSIRMRYSKGTEAYDNFAELAGAGSSGPSKKARDKKEQKLTYLNIDWQALQAEAYDAGWLKAWIRQPFDRINYPVVQGGDNDYFLDHLFTGEYCYKGSIFIDYRCEAPFEQFNTVIYGHRMRDYTMFWSLNQYFNDSSYYAQNPVMDLYTPAANYEVQIFGAAHVDAADGYIYNMNFPDDRSKQDYLDWISANNQLAGYTGGVSVTPADKLIMMSTCTRQNDDKRLVVWGKLAPLPGAPGDEVKPSIVP